MATAPIGILATGSYLPKKEVGNEEIAPRFGVTPEWIERKTMIRARRAAAPWEAASDLAIQACTHALAQAGLPAERVDHLVVATSTGDFAVPPTSCVVQSAIGATRAACLDVNVACSGFVYGLAVAQGLVALRPGTLALVVASDVWSRFTNPNDRSTSVLLGDGAGAAVVGAVAAPSGIVDVHLRGHGDAGDLLVVEAGGSRRPASVESVRDGGHYLAMKGRAVTEFVLDSLPKVVGDVLARAGVRPDEVDHFVPHQANGVLLHGLFERLGLTNATHHVTVDRYGNLGAASIPVTLDDANGAGSLHDGDLVLLVGFGGGMAVGTCLLRWGSGAAGD